MSIRYRSFNNYFQERFSGKVAKLSINGGFSCPNRDGTLGSKGCIFCSEKGSGDFAADKGMSITDQMKEQSQIAKSKWETEKFIPYFQSFTNTYGSIDYLRRVYDEALAFPGVVGLAIATRADCLSEEIIDLLAEYHEKTFLWVEMGLQSMRPETIDFIGRGYSQEVFDRGVEALHKKGIRVLVHGIFGLPREGVRDMISIIHYVNNRNIWGIKFHSLYIQKKTALARLYRERPFRLLTKEEYVTLVCDGLERLREDVVVHRLTGDCKREELLEPLWSGNKLSVIGAIQRELKIRDSYQGKYYNYKEDL